MHTVIRFSCLTKICPLDKIFTDIKKKPQEIYISLPSETTKILPNFASKPVFRTSTCIIIRQWFDVWYEPTPTYVWWPGHRYFNCVFQTLETGLWSRSSNLSCGRRTLKEIYIYLSWLDVGEVVATRLKSREREELCFLAVGRTCIRLLSVFAILSRRRHRIRHT